MNFVLTKTLFLLPNFHGNAQSQIMTIFPRKTGNSPDRNLFGQLAMNPRT